MRSVEGEIKQSLLVGVTTAYSLVIPAGAEIKIDDGEPISLQYAVCLPTSCQVQMDLTKEIFDEMRKGNRYWHQADMLNALTNVRPWGKADIDQPLLTNLDL